MAINNTNNKDNMTTTTQLINYQDLKMVETLRNTVARDLTDPEFQLFAEICKSSGLNPFKREVWAIKTGGRLHVTTGINGYMAIANNHPQYDGMEIEVEMTADRPVRAICKVHRKDRKFPSVGVALMSEFGKSSPVWVQMPTVMLTKVAKCIALREAFPQELNGTYSEDEVPEYIVAAAPPPPIKNPEYYWYDFGEMAFSKSQLEFLKRRNCHRDDGSLLWCAPAPLGGDKETFRTTAPSTPIEIEKGNPDEAI